MRVFSKPSLALIVAISLTFALGACETVDSWTSSHKDAISVHNATPAPEPIAATTTTQEIAKAEPIAATPVYPPLSDSDLRNMTTKLSGGSVEIYGLDDDQGAGATGGDMISLAPVAPVSSIQMPPGMPLSNNPSVTIYPLDDAGINYDPGASAPQQTWPAAQDDNGMTASPSVWGGGETGGDKMSSTAGKDISRVYFPYGSANLDGADKRVLTDVAQTAKFAPVDRVRVEGHASPKTQVSDPVKAKILNLKESMNRAYSVSRSLIEQGVPAEKIKTVGWGDTVPAGSEPAQRRVDVVTGGGAGY